MVKSIQSVHEIGILHRDIKPGNFCVGRDIPKTRYRPICHLIDFGLSRRFVEPDGTLREPRSNVGFRGTARYASISAHTGVDLGRVDDLWSLFYMTIEFLTGSLPWKGKEKDKIGDMKIKFTNPKLVEGLPKQMLQFYRHLKKLDFYSEPDYTYIANLYEEMFYLTNMPIDVPYDWDYVDTSNDVTKTEGDESMSEVSIDEKPHQPSDMVMEKAYAQAAEPWIKGSTTPVQTLVDPIQPQPPQDPIPSRLTRIRRRLKLAR
jgi:tau tubulin kinase